MAGARELREALAAQYPDSGKIGIRAKDFRLVVKQESNVDYMDGED